MLQRERRTIINKAKEELSFRIGKLDAIIRMFRESYSGYTMNTELQKLGILGLGILILCVLFVGPYLVSYLYKRFNCAENCTQFTMANVALYGGCIYLLLCAMCIIVRLYRISRIDHWVSEVNCIKEKIQNVINILEKELLRIEQLIKTKNVTIGKKGNLDAMIQMWEKKAKTCLYKDGNVLYKIKDCLYWISSISFVALIGPSIALTISTANENCTYNVMLVIYFIITYVIYIGINMIVYYGNYRFGLITYFLSLLSGPFAGVLLWSYFL